MSARYNKVKYYYDAGFWTEAMVKNAVGRWITESECNEILGVTDIKAADKKKGRA